MAFNKPSIRTKVDEYYNDKAGHKNANMSGVDTGFFGNGGQHNAESEARTWAGTTMQRILDNGIDLGENQENFEKMFTEITRSWQDRESADMWGKNKADKMGPHEMLSLCFVMSDLNEMLDDGRIDMDTYAETMGSLFSEDSINALMAGGNLDKSAAFLNIANEVAEWHGDDPSSSRAKTPDPDTAAANKQAMSIGDRAIINETVDYGQNHINELNAQRQASGNWDMPDPYGGMDTMYMSDHQSAMVNMIKDWEDQGLLPEGCDAQALQNHINTNMADYFNSGYSPAAAYSMHAAMADVNGLASDELKREMIAQIASPEGFDSVMLGERDGVEWMSELDLYRLNPDLQVDLNVHSGTETTPVVEDEAESGAEDGKEDESEAESQAEASGQDYDADVKGIDYSILVRDKPSDRFEAIRTRALEYYEHGTQDDLETGMASEGFSPEEIENIRMLSMYDPEYIKSLDADGYAGMFYDGKDMAAVDAEFQAEQAEAAVQVMTYEDPADFMAANNLANPGKMVDEHTAEQIYSSAAAVIGSNEGVEGVEDSVGLEEAVTNAETYVAEGGEAVQHIDGLQDGTGMEVEEEEEEQQDGPSI